MNLRRIAASLALLVTAAAAHAQTSFVGTESAFGTPSGNIFWGALGPEYTAIPNPFTVGVAGMPGLTAKVSQAGSSSFQRRNQSSGWGGNFATGDQLLWTQGANGPASFVFSDAIFGFGTQIQSDYYGSFLATISAYDAANNLLGTYSTTGNSTGNADNSAIFIGIKSTVGISRVVLNATNNGNDFAINDVRIDGVTATPEPATFMLLGTGLFAIGLVRRRKTA